MLSGPRSDEAFTRTIGGLQIPFVVADVVPEKHRLLGQRKQPALHARNDHACAGVAVQHPIYIRPREQHATVNRMTVLVHRVIATHHLTVEIDCDQIGCGDLFEQQPVGVDEITVIVSRVPGRDVSVDEVRPSELNERPITGRQIAADVPLRVAVVSRISHTALPSLPPGCDCGFEAALGRGRSWFHESITGAGSMAVHAQEYRLNLTPGCRASSAALGVMTRELSGSTRRNLPNRGPKSCSLQQSPRCAGRSWMRPFRPGA